MQTSLLIVIGILSILHFGNLAVIAYLIKRLMDDKPFLIKQGPTGPPEVLTRADNRIAREYQTEHNFKAKAQDKYVDISDLPDEMGMAALDDLLKAGK